MTFPNQEKRKYTYLRWTINMIFDYRINSFPDICQKSANKVIIQKIKHMLPEYIIGILVAWGSCDDVVTGMGLYIGLIKISSARKNK